MDRRDEELLGGWRGRRLLVCRACDDLSKIVDALAADDRSDPPPVGAKLPDPPSDLQRAELQNAVAHLLRTILLWNDGQISRQELRRF